MESSTVVTEKLMNAQVQTVWQAISDQKKMNEWYFPIAGFEPVVGFQFDFTVGNEGQAFKHICVVTEVIPERKLSYTWRFEGYPGDTLVTFLLEPQGEKTLVKLVHEGLDTFPADNPAFAFANFQEGWDMIIGKMLKEFVENP